MSQLPASPEELSSLPSPPGGVPDYSAHPFLDPELFARDRDALRYFSRLFRDHVRNDWHYQQLLNRLLHPIGEDHAIEVNERILASYFRDASTYVRELLQLLPPEARMPFVPDRAVEGCHNLRRLGQLLFEPGEGSRAARRRRRFEAQRKLYLAKLLIQVEHTRAVQDGPRHRRHLLQLLDRELWSFVRDTRDYEARYEGEQGEESWRFHVRRVQRQVVGRSYELEVHHFDTRFKRETTGFDYRPGQGEYRVSEAPRYGQMQRSRSASILSKMLRKGINDPTSITDMLGAKFIVGDEGEVHRLAELLHEVLGGPFLFRNQVDLFRRPQDHQRLNRFSAPGFRAFKEDVEILCPPRPGERERPYLYGVELQIFTVESFLQTVHSRDWASHREYKRRQFLEGVLPFVFPAGLYGRPGEAPPAPDGA